MNDRIEGGTSNNHSNNNKKNGRITSMKYRDHKFDFNIINSNIAIQNNQKKNCYLFVRDSVASVWHTHLNINQYA